MTAIPGGIPEGADPYRAPSAKADAGDPPSIRRRRKLEKAWLGASAVFVMLTVGTFFWTFRRGLDLAEFWTNLAWIPTVMGLGVGLASLGTHWVWFGRRGPRAWLRALAVVVPVAAWTFLTTVVFPMGGGSRFYAAFWLRFALLCLLVTLVVDAGRHLFAAIRARAH